MRTIQHPGPITEPALQALPAQLRTVTVRLPSGCTLLEGFERALRHFGSQSAVARLGKSTLWPVVYVLPALSSSPDYAVYYSSRHTPVAPLALESGAITVGIREGRVWLHCHASWHDVDGQWHCGHLLPDETALDAPLDVELTLLGGAGFVVCQDHHTNFSLFKPRALPAMPQVLSAPESQVAEGQVSLSERVGARGVETFSASVRNLNQTGWCVRIAPNADLCSTLEAFCQRLGVGTMQVLGGVGSTVGAVFDDGRVVEPFVTELMIEQGCIVTDQTESAVAKIDVALIDYQGGVHRGRLARGDNPVLVTCELVLAELSG